MFIHVMISFYHVLSPKQMPPGTPFPYPGRLFETRCIIKSSSTLGPWQYQEHQPLAEKNDNFEANLQCLFLQTLGFQTPNVRKYLDPRNIPKTPFHQVFGSLGFCTCHNFGGLFLYLVAEPIQLKNMRKSNWIIFPRDRGEDKKKIFETIT